jgi:hypothetical protein
MGVFVTSDRKRVPAELDFGSFVDLGEKTLPG